MINREKRDAGGGLSDLHGNLTAFEACWRMSGNARRTWSSMEVT
jgi:hypothetical protein